MTEILTHSPLPENTYAWSEVREILGVKNPNYKYYSALQIYKFDRIPQIHINIETLPLKHIARKAEIRARCSHLKGFVPSFVASDDLSIPQKAFHDYGSAYRELRTLFDVLYVGKTVYVNLNKFRFDNGIPKDGSVTIAHTKDINDYLKESADIRKITKNYFLVVY